MTFQCLCNFKHEIENFISVTLLKDKIRLFYPTTGKIVLSLKKKEKKFKHEDEP